VAESCFRSIEKASMSDLQRMVYASRATFAPSRQGSGIELEVARILMQSRRNNPRSGLVGALYYGNGHFFQCLEGESAGIDVLCARIAQDPRHQDMQVLGRHPIEARSFSVWAMKYVPNASAVQALMARYGRKNFDPFTFDETLVAAMLDLLRQGKDADLLQQDASGKRPTGDRASRTPAPPVTSKRRRPLLLGLALLLVAAIAALLLFR
jgi:hypothetical protein